MCMRDHAHRLGPDANYHTFNVANASPQKQSFNNGYWKNLEQTTGLWADTYGTVWIICGPIFEDKHPSEWIGDEGEVKVAVPDAFFKIVARESSNPNRPYVLAFIYPHDEALSSASIQVDHTEYLKSMDEVEQARGLGFFSSLPEDDQKAVESKPAADVWLLEPTDKPLTPFAFTAPAAAPAPTRSEAAARATAVADYINGVAVFIPDGDTVHLKQNGQVYKVRFHGVDAPESDQDSGSEAAEFARNMIGERPLTVKVKEKDRYGRFVGEVFVDGRSVNRELARNGLAWWYEHYASGDLDLKRLCEQARGAKRGLWSKEDPIPPWEWRRNQ